MSGFVVEWAGRQIGSIKTGFNAAVNRAGIEHCPRTICAGPLAA
ncbi:hypothetical protein [Pseudogemmobacter faecipullorum]|nr:hypothetical protein [Pseudogemmobacter faecipullorum]